LLFDLIIAMAKAVEEISRIRRIGRPVISAVKRMLT